ncbi:FecR domain-containing protein [Phenylobacterium sp.]|uniref:FecR family protein n=1 Tax=Phenylobacterium sp. TaxID=1871053 RepID=UPI00301B9AB5
MSVETTRPSDASLAEASSWIVRRQSGDLGPEAQAQLRRWLAAAPENAAALDAALDAWTALENDPVLARRTRRAAAGVMAARAAPVAAAACVALGAWGWFGSAHVEGVETGIGETRTIALRDGSAVRLDAMTRITVRQDLASRRVDIASGQAVFSVAKGRRPFRVRTDQMQVTALGTVFTVSDSEPRDHATLLEGRVEVTHRASGRKVRLVPGEHASAGVGGLLKARTDPETDLAWTQGRIVLRDVTLADAVRRFAPYAEGQVTFGDRWMENLRVSGSFRTADRAAFLRTVADLNDLRLEQTAPDAWRLARP